jgi:hypothetical protein
MLCRRGNIRGTDIGAIRVSRTTSTVEVAAHVARGFAEATREPDPRDPRVLVTPLEGGPAPTHDDTPRQPRGFAPKPARDFAPRPARSRDFAAKPTRDFAPKPARPRDFQAKPAREVPSKPVQDVPPKRPSPRRRAVPPRSRNRSSRA